jgi:hypothetical protein
MIRIIVTCTLLMMLALGVIGGCNGSGGGDIIEPTPIPEPTPPPDLSEACLNCPCDFFGIPMTVECWGDDALTFISGSQILDDLPGWCMINDANRRSRTMKVSPVSCEVGSFQSSNCNAPDDYLDLVPQDQRTSCRTCLGEYATALNDAGISVIGGPPYICATHE